MKRRRKQPTWQHEDRIGKPRGLRSWVTRLLATLRGSDATSRNSGGGRRPTNTPQRGKGGQRHIAGEELSGWRPLSASEVLIWLAVALVAGAFLLLLGRQAWAPAAMALVAILGFAWRELRRRR